MPISISYFHFISIISINHHLIQKPQVLLSVPFCLEKHRLSLNFSKDSGGHFPPLNQTKDNYYYCYHYYWFLFNKIMGSWVLNIFGRYMFRLRPGSMYMLITKKQKFNECIKLTCWFNLSKLIKDWWLYAKSMKKFGMIYMNEPWKKGGAIRDLQTTPLVSCEGLTDWESP